LLFAGYIPGLLFNPEDGSSMFVRNIVQFLPDYETSQHITLQQLENASFLNIQSDILVVNEFYNTLAEIPGVARDSIKSESIPEINYGIILKKYNFQRIIIIFILIYLDVISQ
jgi:hypothetical protein